MSSPDLSSWLALVRFRKFGPARMKKLMDAFPDMANAFSASAGSLVAAGIEPKVAEQFVIERPRINPAKEAELLVRHGVDAITLRDARYPALLKTLFDPPPVLFVRGTLPDPNRVHVAVVGSRHPTRYGEQVAAEFAGAMARAGAVVVSGLAYGVDAAAHEAALEAGGTTLAVLGGGLDDANVYPSQHRALLSRLVAGGGAALSEFPPGTHVMKQNFPFRNRVIAGLCQGTLVVEAKATSGSLITARCAIEAGRDVFAVPGPIHAPLSEGPNNFVKSGAFLATCPEDVLSRLGLATRESKPDYIAGSPEEEAIYAALAREPQHADELTAKTGLPAPTVTSTLTLMELKGSARHLGGLYYVRG